MNKLLSSMERTYNRIPQKLIDYLYYIAFLLVLIYQYVFLTRFNKEPLQPLYVAGAGLAGIVLILRFLNVKNESRATIGFAVVLLLIGGSYFIARQSHYYLVLAMLMVGALRVEDKKIFAVYLLVTTVFFAVMFVHFLITTPDWNLSDKWWVGIRFGSINSTDCQGMVFFLLVAWLFYTGGEVQYMELLAIGAIVLWFWWHTKAEINMYCSMFCLVLVGIRKCASALGLKTCLKPRQIVSYIASVSFLLCAAVMIFLAVRYDPDNEKWWALHKLLHNRLSTPHSAFLKYPPCLWGTEYVQVGHGASNFEELYAQYGYTFIDSSYPNILINHGYLVFAMIMGAMSFVSFRYARKGELLKVLLLAVIAVDCAAESHLKEVSCNVWLLLPFANIGDSVHTYFEESPALLGVRQ